MRSTAEDAVTTPVVPSELGSISPLSAPTQRRKLNVRAQTTTRFHVQLEDHAGTWMFHCHILEHAERGMMGELEVSE